MSFSTVALTLQALEEGHQFDVLDAGANASLKQAYADAEYGLAKRIVDRLSAAVDEFNKPY